MRLRPARSGCCSTWCRTTRAIGIRGSWMRAGAGTPSIGTGTCGRIRDRRRAAEQLEERVRRGRHGRWTRRRASTTCTTSCPGSPTSIGGTRTSAGVRRDLARVVRSRGGGVPHRRRPRDHQGRSASRRSVLGRRNRVAARRSVPQQAPARGARRAAAVASRRRRLRSVEGADRRDVGARSARARPLLRWGRELHMAFNFAFAMAPFEAAELREIVQATERRSAPTRGRCGRRPTTTSGGWRRGGQRRDEGRARCALFVLLMLRGTPVLYAGDEIGLTDVESARPSPGRGVGPRGTQPRRGQDADDLGARAGARVHRSGSSPGSLRRWPRSVADQRADPRSMLSWCRRVIELRRARADLHAGSQDRSTGEPVFAWKRGRTSRSPRTCRRRTRNGPLPDGELVFASHGVRRARPVAGVELSPWGCAVVSGP